MIDARTQKEMIPVEESFAAWYNVVACGGSHFLV